MEDTMRKTSGPKSSELIEYFAAIDEEDRETILASTGIDSFLFYGIIENHLTYKASAEQIDPELELLKVAASRRTRAARKKNIIYGTWLATALKARAAGYSYDMLVSFINSKQTRYKISKSYLYHLLAPFQDVIDQIRQGNVPSAEDIENVIAGDHANEN
jgi:hypothetical protein